MSEQQFRTRCVALFWQGFTVGMIAMKTARSAAKVEAVLFAKVAS